MRRAIEAARFIWTHPANRGVRARKLAEALAFQARGRLLGKPTIARVGARSRIRVQPGRGQAGLLYANPPDLPEINVWKRQWARAPGLFIDVGANVGAYTLWAIEAGCTVTAVEPDSWAADELEANLALNGYHARVVRAAVAEHAGTVRMTVGQGVTNRIDDHGARSVIATTLDELIGAHNASVKVDVEGAELGVVLGATNALAQKRITLMQLEWTSASELYGVRREQIAAVLEEHGYELLTPTMDGELVTPAHIGPQQPDLFARPKA